MVIWWGQTVAISGREQRQVDADWVVSRRNAK
jgi:hypothetical protein